MPYITSIERMAREEGLEEGLEKGREEARQGSIQTLTMILKHRFAAAVNAYRDQIEHADATTLKLWLDRALTVAHLDELFDEK